MNIRCLAVLGLLASGAAHAAPFADADVEAGRVVHAEHCTECHSRQFAGEGGSQIYTRADRRVKTPEGLAQQITVCTTMLKLPLFPEDELNLAGYLNERYYQFK